ncbi:hypothetical protein [Thermoplasma volcanium]|nr:hypothetical protein [Thermoplasma volcanium]
MSREELRERTGLSREDLKYHLKDSRTGLIPNGIVKEAQGKFSISFKNAKSVEKAVNYLCTRNKIRESIEQFFAESFMSVFGEVYHCDMHDLEQLSPDEFEDYNRFMEKSRAIMDEWKRPDIDSKALHLAKKLLRIRRGDKTPGFMFIYWRLAFHFYALAYYGNTEKMNAESLSLAGMPDFMMYDFANKMLKEDKSFFDIELRQALRRVFLADSYWISPGVKVIHSFGAFRDISFTEQVMFRYLQVDLQLRSLPITELDKTQTDIFKALKGKVPLGYEVIHEDNREIITRWTGKTK